MDEDSPDSAPAGPWLSRSEAARYVGVSSESAIRAAEDNGLMAVADADGQFWHTPAALDAWKWRGRRRAPPKRRASCAKRRGRADRRRASESGRRRPRPSARRLSGKHSSSEARPRRRSVPACGRRRSSCARRSSSRTWTNARPGWRSALTEAKADTDSATWSSVGYCAPSIARPNRGSRSTARRKWSQPGHCVPAGHSLCARTSWRCGETWRSSRAMSSIARRRRFRRRFNRRRLRISSQNCSGRS
jgi:hypothetical protein